MKKILFVCFAVSACFSIQTSAQIPTYTLARIVKAEDELRYDKTLEDLMKNADAKIRARAALAAGRIGNEAAVSALVNLLETDSSAQTRATAAFALGEIESIKGADAILKVLRAAKTADAIRARATEAAGKIAAANAKDEKAKQLGEAILNALEFESGRGAKGNRDVILLGLTAILRARPEKSDVVAAKFLTNSEARIRADAGNTLTRIRARNANDILRKMLAGDTDAVARANAARALGAAVDKDAFDLLLDKATNDADLRVRVSAIRALASLQDAKAADKLIERGENLLADYKKSKFANPTEKNELLEITTTLSRVLPNTNNEKAVKFLTDFDKSENYKSPEIEIALARVSPKKFQQLQREKNYNLINDWQAVSSAAQGAGELANLENTNENDVIKKDAIEKLSYILANGLEPKDNKESAKPEMFPAISDALRAFAAFKPDNLAETLRKYLSHKDVIIRATAAELLGGLEPNNENVSALNDAFLETENDKLNDASLAILDALGKLYPKLPEGDASGLSVLKQFQYALDSPDYLVRRKAVATLKSLNLMGDITNRFEFVRFPAKRTGLASELRVVRADYAQAVSRKNGQVKAVLTTDKGIFTIDLLPEDAPLTVDNFIRLARANFFNGLAVHRVVPNFVVQDGDPRGDGNGGPGWQIRCELNMLSYGRGAVGMALSGKDTGGSQWFVTHSPQPHLDGGYTIFGQVNETGMKIVDSIVRGDKILSVKILDNLPQRKKN